ncbi:MAG: hypothetical protein Kow0068_14920 [Marinilabiliales bacterium]
MKTISFFALFFIICVISFSQVPEKISYQAIIRDSNGDIISSQNIGIQISILQGAATGSVIYAETHSVMTNLHGLVSLEIGTGNIISGDFSNIDWSESPYFIKFETDPTGGSNYTISFTSELLSVPYALWAGGLTITDENGTPYTAVADTSGNVAFESQDITPLEKLVRREKYILDNMTYTKYVHSSEALLDEQTGAYLFDCSGFFCEYVL